ncbi:hypothetical protein V6Z12_A02G035600 [Gossypium hirsutum]
MVPPSAVAGKVQKGLFYPSFRVGFISGVRKAKILAKRAEIGRDLSVLPSHLRRNQGLMVELVAVDGDGTCG